MTSFKKTADAKVAIVGLGYVGLPLAVEFGKHLDTLGFDIDAGRIAELKAGNDRTLETDAAELVGADAGLIDDGAAQGGEPIKAKLLKLVGDEDLHG